MAEKKEKKWRDVDSEGNFDICTIGGCIDKKKIDLRLTGKEKDGERVAVSTELGKSVMTLQANTYDIEKGYDR